MAWNNRRAQYLTREAQQALLRPVAEAHEATNGLPARMEVPMAEKSAAYETRNMERYEAAIQAIVHQAQAVCPRNRER